MDYPKYKGLQIRSLTRSAVEELEELDIIPLELEGILKRSFPCPRGKRKSGIEVRCVHRRGKVLKIVLEEKLPESGKKYWRVRHCGLIGFKKKRFR